MDFFFGGGDDFLIFWNKLFECQFSVWKYIHLEGEYWNNLICIVNENGNIFTLLTFFNIRSKLSYKNYTFVVTMWLTVTKYPCHEWLWIFSFLRRFFFFLYHGQGLYRAWLYMWVTRWVFYKNKQSLTLRRQLGSPPVFRGVRIAHLFSFLRCDLFDFVRCLVCPNITSVFVFAICIAPFILQIKI